MTETAGRTALVGGVRFQIAVVADWEEFASWSPEQIKAFMDGVTKVVEASRLPPSPSPAVMGEK